MSLIRPFAGLRPVPERANDVVAPPYDVLNSEEARERAADRPLSFLHISKAEIDLPPGTDPYDPAVYAKAAENLNKLVAEGVLRREDKPVYYVYRLTMGDHVQTGLVAVASVADYDKNRIRKHEFTRPAKEDDRVRQIEALNAQTGPVLLAYRSQDDIDALIDSATNNPPEYDLVADDGIGHTFWVLDDPATIDRLTDGFEAMEAIYIADGHHRSAAASRVAASKNGPPDAMSRYFLSVIFPHKQMKILDYNRVVKDLNGLSEMQLLEKIATAYDVNQSAEPVSPSRPGEFGMYLGGQWYRLNIHPERIPEDPVARLDVSLLADNLLEPVLDISDPRTDPRIDFVGGIRGLGELEKRVDSGEMAVAFSMFATTMEDLMAVADANEVMPPKSTWFEPKLADGLVSHVLD
ncbi:uncharacterized protein (DUF1015 family) [Thiogranum longum]|uniref:Uncharacterized protein (DUF1015 family) n=1 Tax=Thiogranum longum TaxID=1537524 RepID=A0A4R1HBB5_9GAMM|nr:DUF1015 family protein [Thiogranum longum]TCK17460.1 uncharacterized protein (DUF1015 family) [Thiogranum longum]